MADVPTISAPTGDALKKWIKSKKYRNNATLALEYDTKYALCLLELHPTVTPDDYGTLGTNISAVAGVNGIRLVTDYHSETEVECPALHSEVVSIIADVNYRDNTPPPPE